MTKSPAERVAALYGRSEWSIVREIEKGARAKLTDAVQDFIAYAVEHGSKSGESWYWRHFTRITYEACSGVQPHWSDDRDAMDADELWLLTHIERYMVKGIRLCLKLKLPYKAAFQVAKHMAIAAASDPYAGKDEPRGKAGQKRNDF